MLRDMTVGYSMVYINICETTKTHTDTIRICTTTLTQPSTPLPYLPATPLPYLPATPLSYLPAM